MSYVAAADFREATLAEYCRGLDLDSVEAPADEVDAAITRVSIRIDEWTNDHFETEATTYELDGTGTPKLYLPKRTQSVTTVKTRDSAGTLTTEASTLWRLRSSLVSGGGTIHDVDGYDFLEVIPAQSLSTGAVWPFGPQTVQVAGTFCVSTVPGDIKRAVALLTYHNFKPLREDLRMASRWHTAEVTVEAAVTEPSGIPEVDSILAQYQRPDPPEM